ncbi:hypothetical protein QF042_003558 [Pedobacter sp. W3I1]|uniref:hypothetical protein n=1 Tax=Pedobacter sp. W3I1 TaxID=3042291 RepID=UPI00277D95F4|nr:hypothetical protein [Pedobacter sp. W3I1]MDQ0639993.1 hypothetical protein [Pedobacter sp. W3I1]
MIRSFTIKLFSLALLLLVIACKSPLSEGNLNDLSAIDVRIEISQDLTNKKKNEVTVFLYDKDGKPIRNKSIKMKVNDTDLVYTERQELYYTTTSKYSASDVPVEKEYNFQITLSNGKSYFLGRIAPLAESREKDIICDEKGDFDKDFVVSWKNLRDIDELSIMKSVLLSTSTKTQQNYDSEPEVTKKIGSSGVYIIPKSGYITSKSTISDAEIRFNALKLGTMNPQLLEGSEIKIFGHIDRYIDFEEQNKK